MANGAVARPIYQPALRVITDISRAVNASITTSFAHNYYDTDIVRIVIPLGFGMQQINKKVGKIVSITSDTEFVVDIDTTGFDAFVDPGTNQYAQVIPIAEDSDTVYGATRNTLPSRNR